MHFGLIENLKQTSAEMTKNGFLSWDRLKSLRYTKKYREKYRIYDNYKAFGNYRTATIYIGGSFLSAINIAFVIGVTVRSIPDPPPFSVFFSIL